MGDSWDQITQAHTATPDKPQGNWFFENAPPPPAPKSLKQDPKKPPAKAPEQPSMFAANPIGAAMHAQVDSSQQPIVDFTQLGTPPTPTHSLTGREKTKPTKVQQAVTGVVRGAETSASGFTSPQSLALLAGTFGTGSVPVLGRLISLGFSADMLKSAGEKIPKLVEQVKKGDVEGASQTLTEAGITAGMGVGAGAHGIKGTPKPGVTAFERLSEATARPTAPPPEAVTAPPAAKGKFRPQLLPQAAPIPHPWEKARAAAKPPSWEPHQPPPAAPPGWEPHQAPPAWEPHQPPPAPAARPTQPPAWEPGPPGPFRWEPHQPPAPPTPLREKGWEPHQPGQEPPPEAPPAAPATPVAAPPAAEKPPAQAPPEIPAPVAEKPPPVTPEPPAEAPPAAAPAPEEAPERAAEGRVWQHSDPTPPENVPVRMNTKDIIADPERFQYKAEAVGKGGTTDEFRNVKKWDESSAGVLQVWRDPADGKVYVTNGHHRLEMANRLDVPEMSVKFIDAPDAASARIRGALTNIRDGKGTSMDAAKVFRDGNVTPEEMEREGISPEGKIAKEGVALAGLSDRAFQRVVDGTLLAAHGAAIGETLRGQPATQDSMIDWLRKQRTRYNANEIRDIAEQWKRFEQNGPPPSPEEAAQGSMFDEDVAQKNYFGEKAQIQEEIRQKMKGDKKLFGLLGKESAAVKLEGTGSNVIDVEGNKSVASKAAQLLEVYGKLVNKAGPMEDIITDAARKVAGGMSISDATAEAYPRISAEVEKILRPGGKEAGEPRPVAAPVSGEGGAGAGVQPESPGESPGEKPGEKPEISLKKKETPPDNPLFADESKDIAESAAKDKAKLQGERLTAGFNAPISAEENAGKLKKKPGGQQSFFDSVEDDKQEMLFLKPLENSRPPIIRPNEEVDLRDAMKTAKYRYVSPSQAGPLYAAEQPGRLYVDQLTHKILGTLIAQAMKNPEARTGWDAMAVPGNLLHQLEYHVKNLAEIDGQPLNSNDKMFVGALGKTLAKAREDHPHSMVIIPAGSGRSLRDVRALLRHELAHGDQFQVFADMFPGQNISTRLFDPQVFGHPLVNKAVKSLIGKRYGYSNKVSTVEAELLAHAAGGEYMPKIDPYDGKALRDEKGNLVYTDKIAGLDLTLDEAAEMTGILIESAIKKHGAKHAERLLKNVKRSFREKVNQSIENRGKTNTRSGQRQPPGGNPLGSGGSGGNRERGQGGGSGVQGTLWKKTG